MGSSFPSIFFLVNQFLSRVKSSNAVKSLGNFPVSFLICSSGVEVSVEFGNLSKLFPHFWKCSNVSFVISNV
jgi:hypothetical protein